MKLRSALMIGVLALAIGLAACGGSSGSSSTVDPNAADVSPPGDIPDDQAFVPYKSNGGFTVDVPEGWARTSGPNGVTFTDKLNSVTIDSARAVKALSVAAANTTVVPRLSSSVPGFASASVSAVTRRSGNGVLIAYLAEGKPDSVTGKRVTDAVERYSFSKGNREAILTLSGPQGADNVDPWRTITDSLRWDS